MKGAAARPEGHLAGPPALNILHKTNLTVTPRGARLGRLKKICKLCRPFPPFEVMGPD